MPITEPVDYDVVISGAGMVGALQALLLARLNTSLRILVIEQGEIAGSSPPPYPPAPLPQGEREEGMPRSFDGRRLALSRGTLTLLQQLGLWSALSVDACAITDIQVWSPGKFGRALLSAGEQGIDALGYGVTAADLGAVLMTAAQAESAISWRGATQITQLQPLTNGWQLQLRSLSTPTKPDAVQQKGATQSCAQSPSCHLPSPLVEEGLADRGLLSATISTHLLIVAEGADSPTRTRLGIGHRHVAYQQTACVAVVAVQQVAAGLAYEAMLADGSLALLPINAQRMAMIWVLPTADMQRYRDGDEATSLAALQQTLGRRLTLNGFVTKPAYYELIDQHASEQIRPHAVVLGNAAHTLHPIAGQGFNLAVRDLVALTEVLRLSLAAGQTLGQLSALQIYAQQRHADQARIHAFCHGVVNGFRASLPGLDHCRRLALLMLDVSPALKVGLAQRVLAPRPAHIQTAITHAWLQHQEQQG